MAQTVARGITLEYDVRGDGDPMLLIMGLGTQLIGWPEGFVDRAFEVIRFDNRDSGLSTEIDAPAPSMLSTLMALVRKGPPAAPYLLSDMADDAAALLDALGIESAHIVGASMGGMIAQSLAIQHPHKVRSLTSIMANTGATRTGSIDPWLLPRLRFLTRTTRENAVEKSVALFRLIGGERFDADDHRRSAEASVARSYSPAGHARQTAAISASPDRTEALGRLDVPALVIHGDMDRLILPSGGAATARAIPGAELLCFPDMGHDLPRHRWPDIVGAIARVAGRDVDVQELTGATVG